MSDDQELCALAGEFEWSTLTEENVTWLAPLLSEESVAALREELRRLKHSLTPAGANRQQALHTLPHTEEGAWEKLRVYKEHLLNQRRLCFAYELGERFWRQRAQQQTKRAAELEAENENLRLQVARLKQQLHSLMGIKEAPEDEPAEEPADQEEEPAPRRRRKRGAPKGHRGNTRPIPTQIDVEEDVPPPDSCPRCGGTQVLELGDFDSQYVEDLPPVRREVTHRRYHHGVCTACSQVVRHPDATAGPPVITGPRLAALLGSMRQQLGVSYRKLAQFSTETLQIALTGAGVLGILNRLSDKLEAVYAGLEQVLPQQPVLNGDETGWKMDGRRWYVWCFCNVNLVYFHADPSRGSKVPMAILGQDYAGTVICDFYAGYNFFQFTQRCLVHLLRDLHDELALVPDDPFLLQLRDGVKQIRENGLELQAALAAGEDPGEREKELDKQLDELAALKPPEGKAKTLVGRLIRFKDSLLRFATNPAVESDNNRVERILRSVVIFRKLSFGNRTSPGARRYSVLATIVQTCRLQGKDVSDFLLRVVLAEPAELPALARELCAPALPAANRDPP